VTTPALVTLRIEWLPVSATKTLSPMTATPAGPSNRAATPEPSCPPGRGGFPATVVTAPASVTWRTMWFPVSARKKRVVIPSWMPTPAGPSSRAEPPVPSAKPGICGAPAIVVTNPRLVVSTVRIT